MVNNTAANNDSCYAGNDTDSAPAQNAFEPPDATRPSCSAPDATEVCPFQDLIAVVIPASAAVEGLVGDFGDASSHPAGWWW